MEIASCGLYLQPITNGALEEKFVREFFCPYFIVSLHAITEHGEVVLKGVFAANLLPDGINRVWGTESIEFKIFEALDEIEVLVDYFDDGQSFYFFVGCIQSMELQCQRKFSLA